jgi:16S rRNA (cytosine1402-N4)-methyltransferase
MMQNPEAPAQQRFLDREKNMNVARRAEPGHIPVLLEEAMRFLQPRSGGLYLDATAGGGGHAEAILERSAPGGRIILLDHDADALARARERLTRFSGRFETIQGSFASLLHLIGPDVSFDGIIADLGISSLQLESGRGFSFMKDEELDMRMDSRGRVTAKDLVNSLSERELEKILFEFGEERRSRRIASEIVRMREKKEITTTLELANLVRRVVARAHAVKSLARVFQALRIAVNQELPGLERGLPVLLSRLAPGGRLAVIAYHSLEDRIVKRFFLEAEKGCVCPPDFRSSWCAGGPEGVRMTRKVVKPGPDETKRNPRSRSGRMRVFERTAGGDVS